MNVLVFRVGQLGDMLAALPAFWAVRNHFKHDRLTLLSDVQQGKKYVLAQDLFRRGGLFDDFMTYVFATSRVSKLLHYVQLLRILRARKFDVLVYLYPAERNGAAAERDFRFFTLAGIRKIIGADTGFVSPVKAGGRALERTKSDVELTLDRLAGSEIAVPRSGQLRMDLALGEADESAVQQWLAFQPHDGERPWLGIGPGSKMPAKIWPENRFRDAVSRLIASADVWPVVFGGPEDEPLGARLINDWGRGYNAAGKLGLREAACALRRCRLYLGNDTGTMHLAASEKVPCVAIFSARDVPGRWYPYGVPARVLRKTIDCEGCMLTECLDRRMECLTSIGVDEVVSACVDLLKETETMQGAKQLAQAQ